MFASSSSLEKEIVEYQDDSYESSEGSTGYSSDSSSSNEHYSSGVPDFSLEEFYEMQRRMAYGAGASSSKRQPSPPQDEKEEEEEI